MNFIIYFLLLIVLIIFGLNVWLISLFFVGVFKKDKAAPYVGSFRKELLLMKQNLHLEKNKKLVDLGCGDGKALRFFVKTFGINWFWYDINIFAITLGKTLNRWLGFRKSIHIEKKNFMKVDLSTFDYIYVYLLPVQLAFIENWIWKNMKKDAIIIANSFQFKDHKPFEIIKNKKGKPSIFLYRK